MTGSRLYVTDLDGTFLDPSGRPSATTVSVANRLLANGLQVSYATARSFRSARAVVADVRFTLPVVVYGGAFIVDPVTGSPVVGHYLEDALVEGLLGLCEEHALVPLVYRTEHGADRVMWVDGQESPGITSYLADRRGDPRMRPVSSWAELRGTDAFYVSVIGDREPIEALAAEVEALAAGTVTLNVQSDTYHPEETWLEVTALRANKADAVTFLRDHGGADELICFGDNLNDLAMFSVADRAYAVANAHPDVRAAATAVIGHHADDAVVGWLAGQTVQD